MFTKKNDKWVQIALVSWGPTAADMTDTSYDVNADVLYYKDWITTHKDRLEFYKPADTELIFILHRLFQQMSKNYDVNTYSLMLCSSY